MQRRTFLHSSAAAALATAAPRGARAQGDAQAAARPRSNAGRIFKAVKTGGDVTADQLAKLKDLGFDGIEGVSPGVANPDAYMETVRASGLPVHGVVDMVHWNQRLSSPDPATREAGRKALEQAIIDAKAFGGSSVLLVPGKVEGDDETHQHVWDRSIAEIRPVLPTAAKLGIHILVETVWNGFCYDPVQLRDYIDEIDSPWVKVYLDFGNMQKFAPGHEWVRTLGNRTVKLDVKDWGEANGFCHLGQGDVDWPKLREALAETGFTGWATREGSDASIEDTARLMDELLDL